MGFIAILPFWLVFGMTLLYAPRIMRPEHVTVITRHNANCPDRSKGQGFNDCRCRKSLSIYDPEDQSQVRVKIGERDKNLAEAFRLEYINGHDPKLAARLLIADRVEAEEKAKGDPNRVTIESAIVAFVNNKRMNKRATGTIEFLHSFLGYTDPKSSKVQKPGKLMRWLNGIAVVRPKYLSDLTEGWVEQFVSTWTVSDRVENTHRSTLKAFLGFCVKRKWITENPAANLGYVKEREGYRTGAFEPEQIEAIFEACDSYDPEVPEAEKATWRHRLLVYIKLLYYSGADLADVTQFRPSQIVDGDLFQYARQKTGIRTSQILLPSDLAAELRSLPDACGLTGSAMPFRSTGITLKEDCSKWRWRIERVFTLAGIKTIKTDLGEKTATPKVFRDTFAIESLMSGLDIVVVSQMLGHKSIAMTQKHYMPWTKSRNDAHVALLRAAMAKRQPKQTGKVIKMKSA